MSVHTEWKNFGQRICGGEGVWPTAAENGAPYTGLAQSLYLRKPFARSLTKCAPVFILCLGLYMHYAWYCLERPQGIQPCCIPVG